MREMKRRGMNISVSQYTDLMLSSASIGHFPSFEEIARSYGESGHVPTPTVFAAEILTLAREQKWAEMRELVSSSECRQSVMLNTAMLASLLVNDQLALQLFDEFAITQQRTQSASARFPVDHVTLTAALIACNSLRDSTRAVQIFELAKSLNMTLNTQAIIFLVSCIQQDHPQIIKQHEHEPQFVIASAVAEMANGVFVEIASQKAEPSVLNCNPILLHDYLVLNGIYLIGAKKGFTLSKQRNAQIESAMAEISLRETLNPSIDPSSVLPNFVVNLEAQKLGEKTRAFQSSSEEFAEIPF